MLKNTLDKTYWSQRYHDGQTNWDIGYASEALLAFADHCLEKSDHILIPGAGNAHEAEILYSRGFTKLTVLDISPIPLENLQKRVPNFPREQLVCEDFFEHHGAYDAILEQTFFCALNPNLRDAYNQKMQALLKPGGRLAGLLFDFALGTDGPPFGGDLKLYQNTFSGWQSLQIEPCYNSIEPRKNREFFFIAKK